MHDRIAELRGLRAELEGAQNGPRREIRKDAVADIEEQIERVRGDLAEDADRLEAEAADLAEQGHDGRAGDAAVSARVIRTALEADEKAADTDPEDPRERVALAEARGRALAAANELRQREEQRRLREHLDGGEDQAKPARRRAPAGKRNTAAAKAPEQT